MIPVRGTVMKLAWGWVILNVVLGVVLLAIGSAGVAWMAHAGGTLYGFCTENSSSTLATSAENRGAGHRRFRIPPRGENPNIIDAQFTDKRPDYNDVLDKINREGIGSLTPEEREILERASESIKQRNNT